MKRILFICLLYCNIGVAQSFLPSETYRENLNAVQQKSWDSIVQYWKRNVLQVYARKHKIKISNCETCGFLYIYAHLKIDSIGHCTYTKGTAALCLKNMPLKVEKELMRYFLQLTFPPQLRNLIIVERLGEYLRC